MRVQVESEVFRGALTFEYARLGRYVEPILAKLAEAEKPAAPKRPKKAAPRAPRAKPTAKRKRSA
jgi:hypothetical protein